MKKITLANKMEVRVIDEPFPNDGYKHVYMFGREWSYSDIEKLEEEIKELQNQSITLATTALQETYFMIKDAYRIANNPPGNKEEDALQWKL